MSCCRCSRRNSSASASSATQRRTPLGTSRSPSATNSIPRSGTPFTSPPRGTDSQLSSGRPPHSAHYLTEGVGVQPRKTADRGPDALPPLPALLPAEVLPVRAILHVGCSNLSPHVDNPLLVHNQRIVANRQPRLGQGDVLLFRPLPPCGGVVNNRLRRLADHLDLPLALLLQRGPMTPPYSLHVPDIRTPTHVMRNGHP